MTDPIRYSDDPSLLQFDVVHGWLTESYWSPGIDRETVERAARHSLCAGAYRGDVQVAYARLITDHASFAWLADVIVAPGERGSGVGRGIVRFLIDRPGIATLRRIMLNTFDAHGVYETLGFAPPVRPDFLLERLGPGSAERLKALGR